MENVFKQITGTVWPTPLSRVLISPEISGTDIHFCVAQRFTYTQKAGLYLIQPSDQ